MRIRPALLAALAGCGLAAPAAAQSTVRTSAGYPSREALDRLNLAVEWAVFLPIDGQRDSIQSVQPVDGHQMFVQTRSGLLLAVDARTGERQWSFAFPNRYAGVYPVAVNSRFVFVANLATLYCFDRYTGVLEFAFDPVIQQMAPRATITAAPVADEEFVYVSLGSRQVGAYQIPAAVTMPDPKLRADAKAAMQAGNQPKTPNPADVVASRYPGISRAPAQEDRYEPRGQVRLDISGSLSTQRTPSLSMLPTVTPPYKVKDSRGVYEQLTPSLSTLPSMRQPYKLRDAEGRYVTKTPSIDIIPPSAARVYELNDIRPKGLEPTKRWYYTPTNALRFAPIITPTRLWMATEGSHLLSIDRVDTTRPVRSLLVDAGLSDDVTAPAGRDGTTGFFPLADGSLIAVDLEFGGRDARTAMKVIWRANVGGTMTRIPVTTTDSVYVAGTGYGVARIDRTLGEVVWRTAALDDRLLAVNAEYVYVRDRNGVMRIYDRNRVADETTHRSNPLASIDLSDFGVPVTNTVTDRILLASDNGLLVSLRDNAPKYTAPTLLLPVKAAPPAEKPADKEKKDTPMGEAKPADPMPPKDEKPADPKPPVTKPGDKKPGDKDDKPAETTPPITKPGEKKPGDKDGMSTEAKSPITKPSDFLNLGNKNR
jgi:outer membrane protein assembly factor BamB